MTANRVIKITAPTENRHDIWFQALSFLMNHTSESHKEEHDEESLNMQEFGDLLEAGSYDNQSTTYLGTPQMKSLRLSAGWSHRSLKKQSSLTRHGSMRRLTAKFSRDNRHLYENIPTVQHLPHSQDEQHYHHHHGGDDSSYENVRSCCEGKESITI